MQFYRHFATAKKVTHILALMQHVIHFPKEAMAMAQEKRECTAVLQSLSYPVQREFMDMLTYLVALTHSTVREKEVTACVTLMQEHQWQWKPHHEPSGVLYLLEP